MAKTVHFEIPADDPLRASMLYHDALGWEISRFGDEPYWLVRAGADDEPGANGALVAREDLHRNPVVIAGVEDIDDVLSRVDPAAARWRRESCRFRAWAGRRMSAIRRATRSACSSRTPALPRARPDHGFCVPRSAVPHCPGRARGVRAAAPSRPESQCRLPPACCSAPWPSWKAPCARSAPATPHLIRRGLRR